MCLQRSLVSWSIPEVSIRGRNHSKKTVEFLLSCAQPTRKVFMSTKGTDRKRILWRDASIHQISTTPNLGNLKPEKNRAPGIQFIHPIQSDVEKFAKFNGEITFQLRETAANLSPETSYMCGRVLGQRKTTIARYCCFCGMAVSNWRSLSIRTAAL